ncbi:hypothetical protein C8A03DRAFT_17821, partial [Achaetomium macrosporum]
VGSLGIPRIPPFYYSGRREDEKQIRFESLNVHPRIEHTFYAVALDDWLTAFDCTMWGARGNKDTKLRQVWFPGSHCNVGGGWEDQQIATIAFACEMADQLTSVGVEFSKTEISRMHLLRCAPQRQSQKVGDGRYPQPTRPTSQLPIASMERPTTSPRTPGGYMKDNRIEKLVNTNELVHLFVRILYLYGGLKWTALGRGSIRALTERGYGLDRRDQPSTQPRDARVSNALDPCCSVRSPVAPYYDNVPEIFTAGTDANPFVKTEQPYEGDLHLMADPQLCWVWADKDGSILPEERIGVWERMFIKVNEKLVAWQQKADAAAPKEGPGFFASAGNAIKSVFVSAPQPLTPVAARLKHKYIPEQYRYHDTSSWQRGDTRTRNQLGWRV